MTVWWGEGEDIFTRAIDLDDIKLIGNPWITVGVPYNSPVGFIKNVFAGACAHNLGLSSIDYTYRKYVDNQDIAESELNNDFDSELLEVTSSLKRGLLMLWIV